MFRYAELKDNTPNLANRQIAHIGLTKLYQRFTALFSIFEQLYDLFYAVYSEYETGSYTAHLSRTDIEAIADQLPKRDEWGTEAFKNIKNELKKDPPGKRRKNKKYFYRNPEMSNDILFACI